MATDRIEDQSSAHWSGAVTTRHVLVPLAIGGAIYVSWRAPTLLVFKWARALGLAPAVTEWRATVEPLRNAMPAWALFSLPDAL